MVECPAHNISLNTCSIAVRRPRRGSLLFGVATTSCEIADTLHRLTELKRIVITGRRAHAVNNAAFIAKFQIKEELHTFVGHIGAILDRVLGVQKALDSGDDGDLAKAFRKLTEGWARSQKYFQSPIETRNARQKLMAAVDEVVSSNWGFAKKNNAIEFLDDVEELILSSIPKSGNAYYISGGDYTNCSFGDSGFAWPGLSIEQTTTIYKLFSEGVNDK